ncbi:hypothetical protein [Actinocorallia populi]|uniref:hypothetical protein n=1 Tax=Actinocorallia populi TaxID=2079200 RepID=UPI000D095A25|nr:hypothetical protein [Actinocorallia populi]
MRRFAADVDWWVLLPLAIVWLPVVTDSPWSWHSVVWPLASLAVILFFRWSRSRPSARNASSWAVAALVATGAVQVAAGIAAGVLSTVGGVPSRFDLPWGLMWATSGVRGEGVGYEVGNGFTLTPFLTALTVGILRFTFAYRRLKGSSAAAPENAR